VSGPIRPLPWLAVTLVVAAMLQAGSGAPLTPIGWAIAGLMVLCVVFGWALLLWRALPRSRRYYGVDGKEVDRGGS
jgi:hypothetical protein